MQGSKRRRSITNPFRPPSPRSAPNARRQLIPLCPRYPRKISTHQKQPSENQSFSSGTSRYHDTRGLIWQTLRQYPRQCHVRMSASSCKASSSCCKVLFWGSLYPKRVGRLAISVHFFQNAGPLHHERWHVVTREAQLVNLARSLSMGPKITPQYSAVPIPEMHRHLLGSSCVLPVNRPLHYLYISRPSNTRSGVVGT